MKKCSIFLLTFLLLASASAPLVGCSNNGTDNKLERTLDTSLVNVWQNANGDIWLELENYEHNHFELANQTQSASSIDFSLDGGQSWMTSSTSDTILAEERGFYNLMGNNLGNYTFNITGASDQSLFGNEQKYQAGDVISLTFRIPESDTYKASEWSTVETYTIKSTANGSSISFTEHFGTSVYDKEDLENQSTIHFESNGLVLYKEQTFVKFGKISTLPSLTESGMFDVTFTPQEELSETEIAEITKCEYKFVSHTEYSQVSNPDENSYITSTITPNIATTEDNLLSIGRWSDVPTTGITISVNDNSLRWSIDYEIPSGVGSETVTQRYTYLILLVRLKSTDSTTQSSVNIADYEVSIEEIQ